MREIVKPEEERELQIAPFVNDPGNRAKKEIKRRAIEKALHERRVHRRIKIFRRIKKLLNSICIALIAGASLFVIGISATMNFTLFDLWNETPLLSQWFILLVVGILLIMGISNTLPCHREDYKK